MAVEGYRSRAFSLTNEAPLGMFKNCVLPDFKILILFKILGALGAAQAIENRAAENWRGLFSISKVHGTSLSSKANSYYSIVHHVSQIPTLKKDW